MMRLAVLSSKRFGGISQRWLPFADAASAELSLGRLLRLSLFQLSTGMAIVLLTGTLNRVMVVELGQAASWVSLMLAIPLLLAPARALIGYRSDHHRSFPSRRAVSTSANTMPPANSAVRRVVPATESPSTSAP